MNTITEKIVGDLWHHINIDTLTVDELPGANASLFCCEEETDGG